jgi:hypothetical protein
MSHNRKRRFLGFETRTQPLLSRPAFVRRMLAAFGAALLLIGLSLFAGMLGYRYLEGMEWIDAFANAAMILSGMGPLAPLEQWSAKLFAGCYALYSGLALVLAVGLIIAPIVHRILHRFHVDSSKGS